MAFLTYKKFHEQESVETLIQILRDNEVEFEVTETAQAISHLVPCAYQN